MLKICTPIVCSFIPFALSGVTIVQWGADANMTGGTFGLNLSAASTPTQLDLSDPAMPDPVTNGGSYYPNNTNSRSPVFFFTQDVEAGAADTRVINGSPPANSEMRLGMRDTDGSDGYHAKGSMIAVWTKDGYNYPSGPSHGFLNGGDANPVTLTSLSVNPFTGNGGASESYPFYWVIRLGSTWYANDAGPVSSAGDLADPSAVDWFEFDPLTDFTDLSNSGSAGPLSNFDNLTAAGMMLTFDHTSTGTIYLLPETTRFQVDGTVVPEPRTTALLLGATGVLAALVIQRRKRHAC